MTVVKALELINVDAIPHTYSNFLTCHAWCFEYEGIKYRLAEWQGVKLFVETVRLPRTTLDEILINKEVS